VVSQLRIVENLGKDPVADKLLKNLVAFTSVIEEVGRTNHPFNPRRMSVKQSAGTPGSQTRFCADQPLTPGEEQ
jgi:hypothetical protein